MAQCMDRTLDQIRAIVRGLDHHARRQAIFQIRQLSLGILNHLVRIGTKARDDHAAHHHHPLGRPQDSSSMPTSAGPLIVEAESS